MRRFRRAVAASAVVVLILQSLATVLTYVGVFGVLWLHILGLALWGVKRRAGRDDVPPDSQ